MGASFFFYDLETSGFSPREGRIMQFAGQRTDLDLQPLGPPVNHLIKLTDDVLPSPDAVMVTGITPQKTLAEGLSEAEFLKVFQEEVVRPNTIFVGFNNIRFDDEFMRFLLYRNFYDSYEWQWRDNCSRWDLLDVVRMTRALKPEGIKWPFAPEGKPTNRLEFLTAVNKLDHQQAHDALNDVTATIALARLLRDRQPQLFQHLLDSRKKDKIRQIVETGKPFMYASGRYPSEYLHTTAAVMLGRHAQQDYILVYDLRYDPAPFLKLSVDELIKAWQFNKEEGAVRLPVKTLKYNRCPAVVPGVVHDQASLERLQLNRADIARNLKAITAAADTFVDKLFQAVKRMDEARDRAQAEIVDNQLTVDGRLYDGFVGDTDKTVMRAIRAAPPADLSRLADSLRDERLKTLLPLYKARNYPSALSADERSDWDSFCHRKLMAGGDGSRLAAYLTRLQELAAGPLTDEQHYLLEELRLYGEAMIPADAAG